ECGKQSTASYEPSHDTRILEVPTSVPSATDSAGNKLEFGQPNNVIAPILGKENFVGDLNQANHATTETLAAEEAWTVVTNNKGKQKVGNNSKKS
ncbi:hypothetical protein PIB30_105709, partial [Stylosanthes scabra]|nr:hypothetical protein [Stylosanthes scabra]